MDFTEIFKGESLTLEQFNERTANMKLADLSGGEYVAKGKYDSDLKKARDDLKTAKDTIATLEANKGDTDALQAELDKYKQADEARQKAEREAQEQAAKDERFKAVVGDRQFVDAISERGAKAAFFDLISDPANVGKGDAELFDTLTKDAAVWKNPQQVKVTIPGVENHGGTTYTREQIRAMTPEQINANWADVSASLKGMN